MKKVNIRFCLFLCALIFFVVTSCSKSVSRSSFSSELDSVDGIIAQRNFGVAKNLLKKLEKNVITANNALSVAKRYIQLGLLDNAENFLEMAVKKYPKDARVAAVYVNLLLQKGAYLDASNHARILADTQYNSLLAELSLHRAENFKDVSLAESYEIAGRVTKNPVFFRNAAVLYATTGDYAKSLEYHPDKMSVYDTGLFWATVAYDSGDWAKCVSDISKIEDSYEARVLKADALMHMNRVSEAKAIWQDLVDTQKRVKPEILLNVARMEMLDGDYVSCRASILKLMDKYPDYVPALVFYADFVQMLDITPEEDSLTAAVRETGYKTLAMEAAEQMERIPLTEPLSRMEKYLERNEKNAADENSRYYEMLIEKQRLLWKMQGTPKQQRLIDMWHILEQCTEDNKPFAPYLVRYATWLFMSMERYDDADKMLSGHFNAKYGTDDAIAIITRLADWEAEYKAYLLCKNENDFNRAEWIYSAIIHQDDACHIPLNLSAIYEAKGNFDRALKLCAEASRKAKTDAEKSDIHYRIAELQISRGDFDGATLSLNYATELNPNNTRARLLLKKIQL